MSFRSSIPLMVVDSLRSRHRESLGGLLPFDVTIITTTMEQESIKTLKY